METNAPKKGMTKGNRYLLLYKQGKKLSDSRLMMCSMDGLLSKYEIAIYEKMSSM